MLRLVIVVVSVYSRSVYSKSVYSKSKFVVEICLCITLATTLITSTKSFDSPQRGAFAFERGFHMRTRTGKPGHYGADRYALDVGDLAVTQSFQHHQQQHRALFFHQRRQCAGNVAAFGFGPAG